MMKDTIDICDSRGKTTCIVTQGVTLTMNVENDANISKNVQEIENK